MPPLQLDLPDLSPPPPRPAATLLPAAPQDDPWPEKFRVVIAKKSQLALDQIAAAVSAACGPADVALCRTAATALAAVHEQPAHLGVFGLSLPDMDGLDLLRQVEQEGRVFRTLIVSSRRDERVREMLRPSHVDGFFDPVLDGFTALVEAIRTVAEGGIWFGRGVAEVWPSHSGPPRLAQMLSPLELRVFAVIGDGCDDKVATRMLGMSLHAVETHRTAIMHKLGVPTRAALMREAVRRGVVRITEDRILRPGFNCELKPAEW
jgi:two-component system nitrate/nitrite response regulator NarL